MKKIALLLLLLPIAVGAQIPKAKNRFIVIAHRGDHTQAPENTLKSLEAAISSGADYVEIDLRTSKDGHLVIHHDETVNRMTDGNGSIKSLTLNELGRLRVADKTHPEFGSFTIPTFKEVLKIAKGKINIYLDFKDGNVATTWRTIKEEGMEKSVVVYINHQKQLEDWRKVAPQIPIIVSLPASINNEEKLANFLDSMNAEILDGAYDQYTAPMVKTANEKSRSVWADIQGVNENPEEWANALLTNLQGLQTDNPKALINFLEVKGLR